MACFRPSYYYPRYYQMEHSIAYPPAASSFVVVFPDTSYLQSTAAPSQVQQPPRSLIYTSLEPYDPSNFSISNSPDSPSGSESYSISDSSVESSVDYYHADNQANVFGGYSHDQYDEHIKSLYSPPPMVNLPGDAAKPAQHFIMKNEQNLNNTYQHYVDASRQPSSPYQYSPEASSQINDQFSGGYAATTSQPYAFTTGFHNSSGSLLSSTSEKSSVDANYVLTSTSHMRQTAIQSPIYPACAQPIEVSPQFVCMEELTSSDEHPYPATNVEVCDPRVTVSGGDDDGNLADVARHMQNFGGRTRRDSDLSRVSVAALPSSTYSGSQNSDEDDQLDDADAIGDDDYLDSGESDMGGDDYDDDSHSRSTRKTPKPKREPSEVDLESPSILDSVFDPRLPIAEFSTRRSRGPINITPVPNLTKKSRGRRVPKSSSIVVAASGSGVSKSARPYKCNAVNCGKCFARGEHLKRHVRSIHTNEKPHKCPYPGCDKDFSRHDNLGQHMKVHKGYSS